MNYEPNDDMSSRKPETAEYVAAYGLMITLSIIFSYLITWVYFLR